jgi:hypothetical protein
MIALQIVEIDENIKLVHQKQRLAPYLVFILINYPWIFFLVKVELRYFLFWRPYIFF